jgi:hypothetical protein
MRVPWLLTLGVAFAVGSFGQRLTLKERDMILGSLPLWTGDKSYTGRPSAYRIPNDDSFVFVYRGLDGKGQALTVVPFRLMDLATLFRKFAHEFTSRKALAGFRIATLFTDGAILKPCRRYCAQVRTVCTFSVMNRTSRLTSTWIVTISPRNSG